MGLCSSPRDSLSRQGRLMMVPQGAPGRSLSPQKHTSALSDIKLVSASGHNPTEASSSPLHPRADPQTLSLQPAHALPHLRHLIRGLHYQYLPQFFFPLLLFFEQLLQQVAERLALLRDHPLQQKDSGTHISVPPERPPCPDPAKHLPYPNGHGMGAAPEQPAQLLSCSCHSTPQLHPFLLDHYLVMPTPSAPRAAPDLQQLFTASIHFITSAHGSLP